MSIFKAVLENLNTELAQRYKLLQEKAYQHGMIFPDMEEITLEQLKKVEATIEREIILQELREDLEIKPEFHIDNEEHLDWYLRKRVDYNAELEAIKAQYEKLKQSTESKLSKLDSLYKSEAEMYTKFNYEKTGKKTMIRPYGTVQLKDEKAKWSIESEKDLQIWLMSLTDEERMEYKCKPKTYDRDLELIKKRAEMIREKQGLEICMGLKYEPAGLHFKLQLPKEKE